MLQSTELSNGRERVSTGKRQRGRKPGTFGFDHDGFPIEVNSFILELRRQGYSIAEISRDAVAEKFQAKGEMIRGRDVTARLRICGITESWPIYRERIIQGQNNSQI
jgi:hypothetical protein